MNDVGSTRPTVTRLAISPISPHINLGALRTYIYAYALARSTKNGLVILRSDDSNASIHNASNTKQHLDFLIDKLRMKIDIHPFNSMDILRTSLFQSKRQDVYQRYLKDLEDREYLTRDGPQHLFSIEVFVRNFFDEIVTKESVVAHRSLKNQLKMMNSGGKEMKSFPITRSDSSFLYHFATVVDDCTMGISHVVRGVDKQNAVTYQEMLRIALGFQPISYLHVPLVLDSERKRLSSRSVDGNICISSLLASGLSMEAIISYLCSSAYGDPEAIYHSLEEFCAIFTPSAIHKSNSIFDVKRIEFLNKYFEKKGGYHFYKNCLQSFLSEYEDGLLSVKDSLMGRLYQEGTSVKLVKDSIIAMMGATQYPIQQHMQPIVARVIDSFDRCLDVDTIFEDVCDDNKQFYSAMRLILTGKETGLKVGHLIELSKALGVLEKRMALAENTLKCYKVQVNSLQHPDKDC